MGISGQIQAPATLTLCKNPDIRWTGLLLDLRADLGYFWAEKKTSSVPEFEPLSPSP
jgi:hypothetical protein